MGRALPGRFQLEAAVQSAHVQRGATGNTNWRAIALLYEGLAAVAPTVGVLVGRAAAVAEAAGPRQGLALLESIPVASVAGYQPYRALRGHLLKRTGDRGAASAAYAQAIGLAEDPAVRAFLAEQARDC